LLNITIYLVNLAVGSSSIQTQTLAMSITVNDTSDQLQQLFDHISIGLAITSPNHTFININDVFCDMLGYEKVELMQLTFKDFTHADDITIDLQNLTKIKKGEISKFSREKRYVRKDKNLIWCSTKVSAVRHENKEILYYVISIEDITQRKLHEEAVALSEEKFSMLFNASPDTILLSRLSDGQIIEANESASKLFEYSRDEGIGKTSVVLNSWSNNADREKFIAQLVSNKVVSNFEFDIRTKSGNIRNVVVSAKIIFFKHTECILSVMHDITEIKQIQEAIRISEDKFSKLFHSSPDAILLTRFSDRKITDVNESASILTEFPKSELLGETPINTKFWYNESEMNEYNELFLKNKRVTNFEATFRTKSGKIKYGLVSGELVLIQDEHYILGIIKDITSRKQSEQEIKLKNEEFAALNEEYMLQNEELAGNVELLGGLISQLEEAKEKAEESDKLKSSFLENVSHEIRTPMNGILGFTELLRHETDNKRREDYIDTIHTCGNRLLYIINDIVEMSKIDSGIVVVQNSNVDLNVMLSNLYREIHVLLNKTKTIVLTPKPPANTVVANTDVTKLQQILVNLVSNAIKFTPKGSIDFGYNLNQDTSEIEFFVNDTGVGIDKIHHESIFKRFRQIDKNYANQDGSGLGLAISKAYVEMLGGRIWVESEPHKGSQFHFTIPLTKPINISNMNSLKEKTKKISFENAVILVAEDEDINFYYLQLITKSANATILRATNGLEAVEICKNNPNIDIVLMDIKMPELNGYEAAKQIKQFRPNLPIIAQTAYGFPDDEKRALAIGCDAYIAKPIAKESLLKLMNDLIRK